MIEHIKWLGHASFYIQTQPAIYIDPWRVVRTTKPADIILITHDHYDHCSITDIEKLCDDKTIILANEKVKQRIPRATLIRPWQSMSFDKLSIKALPAYAPNGLQHKKSEGGLGFVISINYYDIYVTGDTGLIPEMLRISPDIVILPIDNNDTLSVEESIIVLERLKVRWAIPSKWGGGNEGATKLDAEAFRKQAGGRVNVVLPERFVPNT
ncbi:MAG: MBL fold metallo-hydrolase [Chloroflexota bacterium]